MDMTADHITPRFEVKVERNVVYGTAPGYRTEAPAGYVPPLNLILRCSRPKPLPLDMDIYLPDGDGAGGRPLLLMMHGGSFFVGNKNEPGQTEWCRYFASLGYVAASINYRIGFHLSRNDFRGAELRALEDADAALEYLLTEREDLRIAPGCVFVAGTSSGAITALGLAFGLYGKGPSAGEFPRPRLGSGFRICAVANLWGGVHDLSLLERADVPLLSFQSVHDPVVPYDEGYPLERFRLISRMLSGTLFGTHAIHVKALSLGLRSEHHPCPGSRHRLHIGDDGQFTPRFYEVRDAMARFFGEQMAEKSSRPGGSAA